MEGVAPTIDILPWDELRSRAEQTEREVWREAEPSDPERFPPFRLILDAADAVSVKRALDPSTEPVLTRVQQGAGIRSAALLSVGVNEASEALTLATDRTRARRASAGFKVLPEGFGVAYPLLPALGLDEVPVFETKTGLLRRLALALKRVGDIVLAAALLVLLLPFLAVIAVLIKRDSHGPVLFTQDRVGRRGRTFKILKFRTMVADAQEHEGDLAAQCEADPRFVKIECDPRVTRIGRFLRKTSIDELPQLWNVVRGDMSLVGPRPSQPNEVAHYELGHFRRLLVRPGITGMWQVSGRSELGFEDAVELDKAYVRDWGPLLDLKILAKTVVVVLQCQGAC